MYCVLDSENAEERIAKESEGQLLRIKIDAEAILNAFMPFDDEEEKVDPEEEYDGERGDI